MVKILDHGYLDHIEHWGSDEAIVCAARMSTGKGFLGWDPGPCSACQGTGRVEVEVSVRQPGARRVWDSTGRFRFEPPSLVENREVECLGCAGKGKVAGDAKLLQYLYTMKHSTPFEMAGMTVEVQAPIMCFREWHRHRTQSYSEMSARYTPLPAIDYVPTVERCMVVSGTNKQAGAVRGADEITHESALEWLEELADFYDHSERVYQSGLRRGVPKEVARLSVSVGRYSRMRASTDLRNWLAFLTLRMDHKAQYEIRMFANAVGDLIATHFPRTWVLFVDGRPAQPPIKV
jgi:thymidylate synthase (FAD)